MSEDFGGILFYFSTSLPHTKQFVTLAHRLLVQHLLFVIIIYYYICIYIHLYILLYIHGILKFEKKVLMLQNSGMIF